MRQKVIDPYIKYSSLSVNSQILFAQIELILLRYGVESMHISKQDMAQVCCLSVPSIKTALKELKFKGYIVAKNKNSSTIRVGELYKIKIIKENK